MICEHCRRGVVKAPMAWVHDADLSIYCDPFALGGTDLEGKIAKPTNEPLDAVVRGWNNALNRAKDEI